MKYFATCELVNGEYECNPITGISATSKYKQIIDSAINHLERENKHRRDEYKIIKFVELVEHENGFSPSAHIKWADARCEEAKRCNFAIYDFEHPEKGIEY